MKITGIIAEYNPFHNGHIHHINKTKEITGCDLLICTMSGHFVQRGESAITTTVGSGLKQQLKMA